MLKQLLQTDRKNLYGSSLSSTTTVISFLVMVMIWCLMFNVDSTEGIYTSKSYSINVGAEYNAIDLESSGYGFLSGGSMSVNITTKAVCV